MLGQIRLICVRALPRCAWHGCRKMPSVLSMQELRNNSRHTALKGFKSNLEQALLPVDLEK